MDYLERAMVYGWYHNLERSGFPPWADAYVTLKEIDDFTDHYKRFGNEEPFIEFLSRLSNIDRDTFKQMWSMLSEKQRAEIIDKATYNITLIGVRKLLEWITKKLSEEKYKEARAKVLQDAKDYLSGRIYGTILMNRIAFVFWPSVKDIKESGYEYDNFFRGKGLLGYISHTDFMIYVRKYLVEGLEKQK